MDRADRLCALVESARPVAAPRWSPAREPLREHSARRRSGHRAVVAGSRAASRSLCAAAERSPRWA